MEVSPCHASAPELAVMNTHRQRNECGFHNWRYAVEERWPEEPAPRDQHRHGVSCEPETPHTLSCTTSNWAETKRTTRHREILDERP